MIDTFPKYFNIIQMINNNVAIKTNSTCHFDTKITEITKNTETKKQKLNERIFKSKILFFKKIKIKFFYIIQK